MYQTLSFLALASAVAAQNGEWIVGQDVETTSGVLQGHSSAWKPLVSEYLGVPFARPPVGELRFAPPEAYTSNDTIEAAAYGDSCPANINIPDNAEISYETYAQTLLGILGQFDDNFSEDCLTLNLWTKPQSGEEKKAVMVWVYGGGFNSGGSRNAGYNGARLADEHDVIVVGINYRTNIFGFPRADFLDEINLGLLDQRLAVEWVRDNIERFGGDTSRITLFGQSAGGSSVDYYAHAWTEDPIVHAFISQSGVTSDFATNVSAEELASGWYAASESLGCGGEDDGESTLECMREQSWEDILDSIETRAVTPSGAFGPTVDNRTVFADVTRRREEGLFVQKPLLVGNTAYEPAFYQLLAASRNESTDIGSTGDQFRCGPGPVALSRREQHIPAWRYVYAGEYPNQDIGFRGAWHGSEIGMVFGTNELSSRRESTPEQEQLNFVMNTAWTDFAKQPWWGLRMLGWPTYTDEEPTVVLLGGPNSSSITFEWDGNFTEGCPS